VVVSGAVREPPDISPSAVIRSLRLRNVWGVLGRAEVLKLFKSGAPAETDYSLKPFIETNSIFVHIPKTGGVSVSRALYGCLGMGHLALADYRLFLRPRAFDRMFKFTFVRNPFDRLHSAYHFLRSGGMGELDVEFARTVLDKFPNFERFVMDGLELDEASSFWHFRQQTSFLDCEAGRLVGLDFVGHFESLGRDFDQLRARVNPSARLPHFNRTDGRPNYRRAYTSEMVDRVSEVYAPALDVLGYAFDGAERPVKLGRRAAA
jgi:hypothetical protein